MNFYKHHLGDYDGATAHLSWDEDMAYTRLLRTYYRREKPFIDAAEAYRLIRATTRQQKIAVDSVLAEFFDQHPDGWHNKRADQEVTAYQSQASHNRVVGNLGGRPKKTTVVSENNQSGYLNKPINNPNQEPLTKNQNREPEPIASSADAEADPWQLGKEFLVKRGVSASTVGGYLGKLVKDHGREAVIEALQAAIVNEPADVKSYMVAALRGKAAKFDPVAYNARTL